MLDLAPERAAAMTNAVAIAPVPATGRTIVVTEGLKKSYNAQKQILQGIDLQVQEGERIALIGSNGCGKSTLLKCLIGLTPISGGQVTTLSAPLGSKVERARIRQQTGFVFQKHCLVKRHSILSNVVHGMLGEAGSWRGFTQAFARDEWRNRALEALQAVNLSEFALSRADALSGGQQQRVAIARAIVRRPRLLIADEPAASLDPVSGRDVMMLFSQLSRERGLTLLFTSHDMAHAAEFADRIIALRAGKVFFDKPAVDVTDQDLKETFHVAAH